MQDEPSSALATDSADPAAIDPLARGMVDVDAELIVLLGDFELEALCSPLPRQRLRIATRLLAPLACPHRRSPADAPRCLVGRGPPGIHAGHDNVVLRRARVADGDLVVSFVIGTEYVACVVAQTSSRYAFLFGLWTHPDHRRRGLARALMAVVLADADRRGTRLRLRVNPFGSGGPALAVLERFYASFGFEKVAGEDRDGFPWERLPAGSVAEGASP